MNTINYDTQLKPSVHPIASAGATHNGVGVDKIGYDDVELKVEIGAATGAPTSFTVDGKVQESDDNSTFSDVTGGAIAQQTAGSRLVRLRVPNPHARKRYLRAVVVTAFVGGTSPTIPVATQLELGKAQQQPAA